MPIDFFQRACQEPQIDAELFGICDDQDGNKAYTLLTNREDWVATVRNPQLRVVRFTAIDNCIAIVRQNGDMDYRCDGMLTYQDNVVFVELKDQRASWIQPAINQLKVTISHFFETPENVITYRRKRAYACNRQHPKFNFSYASTAQEFYSKYGVRFIIEATILI